MNFGRIIHYTYPDGHPAEGRVFPAIVTRDYAEKTVELCVFSPTPETVPTAIIVDHPMRGCAHLPQKADGSWSDVRYVPPTASMRQQHFAHPTEHDGISDGLEVPEEQPEGQADGNSKLLSDYQPESGVTELSSMSEEEFNDFKAAALKAAVEGE